MDLLSSTPCCSRVGSAQPTERCAKGPWGLGPHSTFYFYSFARMESLADRTYIFGNTPKITPSMLVRYHCHVVSVIVGNTMKNTCWFHFSYGHILSNSKASRDSLVCHSLYRGSCSDQEILISKASQSHWLTQNVSSIRINICSFLLH